LREDVYGSAMTEASLGEPNFLILTALAAGTQHGYGVIEDIQRITDGEVRLHAGTLYAVLDRLRKAGLIDVEREEVVQSRLRRYYRLSGAGAQRLAVESQRLQRHAKVAHQRLRRADLTLGTAAA
jgi:DNA-binding PadR family transcriptional regulator